MNSFLRFFLINVSLLAGIAASAAPASKGKPKPAATGAQSSTDFQQIKTHIDALLTQRTKPEPLPANLPNPFQLPNVAPVDHEKDPKISTEKLAPSSDSEMLLYYGASLRISGTVRINDQTHLIINQTPYKEGDIFVIKTKDAVTKLRIIGFAPGELTLGLNDAVQVIKFKK